MTTEAGHSLPSWLHSRHVWPVFGLLAGVLIALAAGLAAYERQEIEHTAVEQGALYARVLEDQANRTFNGVDLALSSAAETSRAQLANAQHEDLSRLLQQSMQTLPFLRSISLIDSEGRVLASSSPANLGIRLQRGRLLSERMSAGLGPLQPGRDLADLADAPGAPPSPGQRYLMSVVRPLRTDGAGHWLVATLNPDYFANQYSLLLADTPLRAALLSYSGQLLVPSEGSRRNAGEWLRATPIFAQELPAGREKGQIQGISLEGDEAFTAYRSARQQPLVIAVETPARVVAAEWRTVALNIAGGTLVALLLLGGLSAMAWRSLRGHEAVTGDLQRAQGNLAAQHAFTDQLFQISPIPMAVKDAQGHFLRVNQSWVDFTGISADRAIGTNLGRLYPAQLAAPHEVQEQMSIASGQAVNYEEQVLDRDGLPRDVMVRVTPFNGPDGKVAGVIACLMDVTEFREAAQRTLDAKDAAERSNAAKSEFLANISHELRTPLQSILGFAELGTTRAKEQPRLQGMFSTIHGAGQRMLGLVNNLLDLSRLESTVGEIELRPLNIEPTLRAVVDELQPLALARQITLQLPAQAVSMWAAADAQRLQQVLRNVLANAIRFAPTASNIELAWQAGTDGQWQVMVRDHGPGIPADELDEIFEAFVQSSRTKDGSGGTGLGLAICRKIMAGHHGSISAHNHPEGGAVFEIHLPAMAANDVLAAQALDRARRAPA